MFQSIITRRIRGLPTRAGCKNVIELHGNVFDNYCPHCGRKYSMEFVRGYRKKYLCARRARRRCGECMPVWRDGDNRIMTRAAEEVQRADAAGAGNQPEVLSMHPNW